MAINFNSLPQEQPSAFAVVAKGLYKAKIAKAEMKQGKDPNKPPYLNLQLDILDEADQKVTTIWEILTESSEGLMGYKILRVTRAAGLELSGSVELEDIGKMLQERMIQVFITQEKWQDKDRNVVDINQTGIYLKVDEDPLAEAEANAEAIGEAFQEAADAATVGAAPTSNY